MIRPRAHPSEHVRVPGAVLERPAVCTGRLEHAAESIGLVCCAESRDSALWGFLPREFLELTGGRARVHYPKPLIRAMQRASLMAGVRTGPLEHMVCFQSTVIVRAERVSFPVTFTAWRNTSNADRDLMCRNGGKGGR